MKKHIAIRILSALGGAALWLVSLGMLAETFFHLPLAEKIGQLLNAGTPAAVLVTLLLSIALACFGTCCLLMLSTRRVANSKGFVMQKGENGMIGVSVKSIEGLAQTCVKQHEVISSAEIAVVERRDGIVILLNIREQAGVNIPLAVGALQKQIKQYVSTCTGVDVREVRVMVENTEDSVVESPYIVEQIPPAPVEQAAAPAAPAMAAQAAAVEETPAEPIEAAQEQETIPMTEEPAAQEPAVPAVNIPVVPMGPMIPEMPEILEEDDRPLHQRLFGTEEQPAIVPTPPELVMAPVPEETPDEAPAEMPEETETLPSDDLDADAVLEVVQAMGAENGAQPEQRDESDQQDAYQSK